jgi:hypothetical protein
VRWALNSNGFGRGRAPACGEFCGWVWPSHPASWSAVPARLRPGASQIARLTAAAVFSYFVANAYSPGILDLTAPLTALLVVKASTIGTLRMGLVRVGAVLTGVLVARPPEVSHSADRWAREQRPVTMTGSERSHESEIPWQ